MANPQQEHGHIRIANTLWEALCRTRIPGEARLVLDTIIRQTWGYGKKSDMITLDKFAVMTGLRKADVIRAIKKLYQMNLISKNANGKYHFQKDFDKWKPLAKKQIISNKANSISNKANNPLAKKQISTDEPITITSKTLIKRHKRYKKHPRLFESLYSQYPDKQGKEQAWERFNKQVRTKKDYSDICKALKNYLHRLAANSDWLRPQMASVWFNGNSKHDGKGWRNFIEDYTWKKNESKFNTGAAAVKTDAEIKKTKESFWNGDKNGQV